MFLWPAGLSQGEISTHKTMKKYKVMLPKEARDAGYVSLTTPYSEANETHMIWLGRVLDDMRGCDAVVVDHGNKYEVARHRTELILD